MTDLLEAEHLDLVGVSARVKYEPKEDEQAPGKVDLEKMRQEWGATPQALEAMNHLANTAARAQRK